MADAQFTGAASGAAAGSMFGPVGMVVGGFVGMAMGGSGRDAQRKAVKRATEQSYSIGDQTYQYINKGRVEAEEAFQHDMSTARARFASSGGRLEGSAWDQASGEVIRQRDERLADLGTEEKAFRNSDAYGFIKDDFENQGNVSMSHTQTKNVDRYKVSMGRGTGVTGASMFAPEHLKMLRSGTSGKGKELITRYENYSQSIKPSMDEYMDYRFGTDEQKATYVDDMTTRIKEANKRFDIDKAAADATAFRGSRFHSAERYR